jgi:hypothetical protein
MSGSSYWFALSQRTCVPLLRVRFLQMDPKFLRNQVGSMCSSSSTCSDSGSNSNGGIIIGQQLPCCFAAQPQCNSWSAAGQDSLSRPAMKGCAGTMNNRSNSVAVLADAMRCSSGSKQHNSVQPMLLCTTVA